MKATRKRTDGVKKLLQASQAQGCTVSMSEGAWHVRCPRGVVKVTASSRADLGSIRRQLRDAGVAMNPGDHCPGRAYAPRGGSSYELVVINPGAPKWPEKLTAKQRDALLLLLMSGSAIHAESARAEWSPTARERAKKLSAELMKCAREVRPAPRKGRSRESVDVDKAIAAYRASEDFWSLEDGIGGVPAWPTPSVHSVSSYRHGAVVTDWRGESGSVVSVCRAVKGRPNRVVVEWERWGRQAHFPLELQDLGRRTRRPARRVGARAVDTESSRRVISSWNAARNPDEPTVSAGPEDLLSTWKKAKAK